MSDIGDHHQLVDSIAVSPFTNLRRAGLSMKHVCIDLFRFYTRAISHNVAAGGIYYPSVSIAQFPAMLNV